MPKKTNWIIATGDKYETYYANVVRDKTPQELGKYIKTHVDELMGHFEIMAGRCARTRDDSNKIHCILASLYNDFENCDSQDDYPCLANKIIMELSKMEDLDVFNNFYYVEDLSYTKILEYNLSLAEMFN